MKVRIAAVGRLRAGPEEALVSDYLDRFDKTGRGLGLGPVTVHEVEAKKGGMAAEAALLDKAIGQASPVCILDERGKVMSSPDFADLLGRWRDQGRAEAAFVIGGADGIDPDLRARADMAISFGKMVWPHMLVRVMLAEQLYRAATILSGGPYHRA
ncbi:23S rRNA (pseudouridine(1915)-N(3))-methyltransferase RlmH [Alphaproteobacteria bacterium GH1-50]|uniref:Ribosomal RNA large subunit methyltransferase H n=1 Tax=Kangsaoukella pontilimi TaxID=2691042 RepID=A0A7C9MGA1_9RHOB|nr:23S rRNA (pseudouridine(1915)-N(3))-methyltransferase RlmH [Kangsaoukella pontilimi]MXQ09412.1 23S rRNA (pseudouridine(1915)-N(3))-methyltransferase RlmH [Kangsaoukella pontilimi]